MHSQWKHTQIKTKWIIQSPYTIWYLLEENCKTRRESFKFWDLVWLILEIWRSYFSGLFSAASPVKAADSRPVYYGFSGPLDPPPRCCLRHGLTAPNVCFCCLCKQTKHSNVYFSYLYKQKIFQMLFFHLLYKQKTVQSRSTVFLPDRKKLQYKPLMRRDRVILI